MMLLSDSQLLRYTYDIYEKNFQAINTIMFRFFSNLTKAFLLTLPLVSAQFPKRGLAYNEDISITGFGGGEVFWQYNWDSNTNYAQDYTEYTPMLWSDTPDHTDEWDANVQKWLNTGKLPTIHLIGFNEVDNPGQSNLSPQEAAASYLQWITPYASKGATLVSPSVTNAATGIPWIQEFMGLCTDCDITFYNFHWYDSTSNFAYFQEYITEACAAVAPARIWITEFEALPDDPAAQSAFLAQAIPWLDNTPCVDRYAWFGSADPDTNLLVGHGPQLSALGEQYVSEGF